MTLPHLPRVRAAALARLRALQTAAALGGVALAALAPGVAAQTGRTPEAPAARPAARPGARLLDRPVRRIDALAPDGGGTGQAEALGAFAAAPAFAAPQTNPFRLRDVVQPSSYSKPSVADLDGDGDLDVLVGDVFGRFVYFENTAGPGATPAFAPAQTNPFGLSDIGYFAAPSVADLDGDGDLDVLTGETFVYFENTAGPGVAPTFAAPQTNPFGLSSPGNMLTPSVADLDGDGDLDVLSGEFYGSFFYFENTAGAGATPAFAPAQTNPFGLSKVESGSTPSLADLDGDGDLDVLSASGVYYDRLVYFENTGTAAAPAFAPAQANPFGLSGVGYYAAPSVADLDGDGDPDVLAGERDGTLVYFENTGTAAAPAFTPPRPNRFGLTDVFLPSAHSTPSLADLDGDGDLDVLAGSQSGPIIFFENTGTAAAPAFAAPRARLYRLSGFGVFTTPSVADLDGDGDLDVLSGERGGSFRHFENTAAPGATPAFSGAQMLRFGLDRVRLGYRHPAPTVADFDGDGDLDVLAGTNGGTFFYFENTAGPGAEPILATAERNPFGQRNPFGLSSYGRFSTPSVADLDGDGDLDMLAGDRDGTLVYFENTAGPRATPAFTQRPSNPFGLSDVGSYSAPSMADLDGDGDLDVLVGTQSGSFVYFENTGDAVGTRTARVTGDEGWRMVAAPSASATVDDLLGSTHTQCFPGADYTGALCTGTGGRTPNVYVYDESQPGDLDVGFRAPASQGEGLPLGAGVFAYLFADDDVSQPGVQGGFPKTLAVTGTPAATRFGWGAAGPGPLGYTDTGSPTDDGWNLLGNPFGSWFDWDAVELTGVNAPVYVYDDAVSDYREYAAGAGDLPGGIVGPFQGFWVQANGPGPGLTAREAVSNGGPLYLTPDDDRLVVSLELAPAEGAQRSSVSVAWGTAGAEGGRDGLDAVALVPPAAAHVRLAAVVDGTGLAVDHRPALEGRAEVAVAAEAHGLSGAFVLRWPSFDASALPAGTRAVLIDRETGAETDLADATEYRFSLDDAAGATASGAALAAPAAEVFRPGAEGARLGGARFALVVSGPATDAEGGPAGVALSDASPNPTASRAVFRLTVPGSERVTAEVFDALGRRVAVAFDAEVTGAAEVAVEAGGLAPGVYVVRVTGASFAEARRLTVAR